MEDWKTHPIYMKFPSKLDENIELLAKNNRFSEIEKGTLLLHHLSVHDEYAVDDRKYGEAVAAGWVTKGVAAQNDYPTTDPDIVQLHHYYGKIRAAQLNGVPTSLAETTIGSPPVSSRLSATQPSDYKCRDCGYISKSSDDDAFEHTKTALHTKGFDLVK